MYVAIAIAVVVIVIVIVFAMQKPKELPPAKTEKEALPPRKEERKPAKKEERPAEPRPAAKAEPAAPAAAAPSERKPAVSAAAPAAPPADAADDDELDAEPEAPVHERALGRPANVAGLRRGLARSRDAGGFFGKLRALFGGKEALDPAIAEEIEEVLLASDVGVGTTAVLLERVKEALERGDGKDPERVWGILREKALEILRADGKAGPFQLNARPTVVLLIGVNGAGKTTTIGKLATRLKTAGRKVVLAAGDTFRAAAVQQLQVWGTRVGCEVVTGKEGSDPASVVFDAIKQADASGVDVVLADTAGRLHTKTNLMAEMEKIARSASKALAGAPHEVFLVIDATNGQNALAQARQFTETLPVTGVVLTKLDGTAKGGVVLGIADALKLPVRFVGLGERAEDLHEFEPEAFVEALLGSDDETSAN